MVRDWEVATNYTILIEFYLGKVLYDYEKSYKGATPKVIFLQYKGPEEYTKLITRRKKRGGTEIDYSKTVGNIMADPGRITMAVKLINELKKAYNIKRIML